MASSDGFASSAGTRLLSSVLHDEPELIEKLAICLDDTRRMVMNYRHLARELNVDEDVFTREEHHNHHSPAAIMFEHLRDSYPDLRVEQIKHALAEIGRNDLVRLLETKEMANPGGLFADLITNDLELLETLAYRLDRVRPALSGVRDWGDLGMEMGVPVSVLNGLESESQRREESPTKAFLHWVTVSRPAITFIDFVKALERIERYDVIEMIRQQFPDICEASHPSYVVARGERAMAAYQRALETGETLDKRVKIYLIGQDRVGKTSLGKALKGEKFNPKEPSTDGVQMHEPVMNAGLQPWKYSIMQEETTTYRQKCAEYISTYLLTESTGGQQLPTNGENDVKMDETTDQSALGTNQQAKVPDEISGIVVEKLEKKDGTDQEGIWPVIWDFAGQAVYRAIHPIFMSPEAVYLLVVDLTKDLSDIAKCHVQSDGDEESVIQAADCHDTNLDHVMRWLDLLHSLVHSDSCKKSPPVILVGTHAKWKDKNVDKKSDALNSSICKTARVLSQRIVATLNVDNTKAGQPHDQEDPRIISLRRKIIEVADAMPQTKVKFPLKWLQVEDEVYQQAKQRAKYMTRRRFKLEIVDAICQLEEENDFEHLLDFLQDRGTIVNHDRADNPDGLVVLDPQWLIDVLCKIVSVKKEEDEGLAIRSLRDDLGEKGILDPELLDHACSTQKLCNIKDSLLYIMKKFNLLCQCKGEDDKPVYLVPCMLTVEPEENLIPCPAINGSQPVYITFDSNYVPYGLFSRLLVLFGEWAASRTSCKQQRFFANAARFVVGESTCVGLVCYKSVIKVHIWAMDQYSDPVHSTPVICAEVLRFLEESLGRLKRECHWLRFVSWKFCGQCRLCLGKVHPETKKCFRHQKRECNDDDCAHYVSLGDSPFCCTDAKGPDLRLPLTWIQEWRTRRTMSQEQYGEFTEIFV
ncbi:uncharacterized protein LOC144636474 [Oculina patagonica]